MDSIKDIFVSYSAFSDQNINHSKSILYARLKTSQRLVILETKMDFIVGHIHFLYLGVHIFKGIPKFIHFTPIAENIRDKLAPWKAHLLSIVGRALLVKYMI